MSFLDPWPGEEAEAEPLREQLRTAPPPWILGHRGSPREAPENTLASLRRALELGLDGFEYDVRACGSGEPVLLHDAHLERTTDGSGLLIDQALPDVSRLDAGDWFHRRYRGEPIPLLQEALELGASGLHMIELKERHLVEPLAELLEECGARQVRVAAFRRDVVLEARDRHLPAMLLAEVANEDDRRFVRDERLTAYGVGPRGWAGEIARADWSFCERWGWSIDDPEELLRACRLPLFGFNTNEGARALAVRELVHLAKGPAPKYPLGVPELEVMPESLDDETLARGGWFGRWRPKVTVRNPLPFPVEARVGVFARSGAFEIEGLPQEALRLPAGAEVELPFQLRGGGRRPGADPLVGVELRFPDPILSEEASTSEPRVRRLLFDVPLARIRRVRADGLARRLTLLAEAPGDAPASVTLIRRGRELVLSIENPGGLEDAHLIAHLDGQTVRGGKTLRLALPVHADDTPAGLPFSCGLEGKRAGSPAYRRFAGGLPEGLGHGVPGRLITARES